MIANVTNQLEWLLFVSKDVNYTYNGLSLKIYGGITYGNEMEDIRGLVFSIEEDT